MERTSVYNCANDSVRFALAQGKTVEVLHYKDSELALA
jgi:hypothetical protein